MRISASRGTRIMGTDGTESGARGFEIGLVMAGALSAGAYTAGVVDFLIQALDQWHEGKRGDDPRCPRHGVSLKVMAGASAGGMSAAIAAAQLGETHTPADDPRQSGPSNNKLFDSWVRRIDITGLLGTADLDADPGGDVVSLLDSTALDEIAAAVFRRQDGPPPPERGYLADPLHVLLTVTNLQSIPYEVRFLGGRDDPPRMSMHGDYIHFALGGSGGVGPEVRPLPPGQYEDAEWKALSLAALATGAFPGALAPRTLSRRVAEYSGRQWPVTIPVGEGDRVVRCGEFRRLPPDFPAPFRDDPDSGLEFLAVDGGVIDNEPLKLARRIIDGERYFYPRSRGESVDRALIAIAPFPDLPTFTVPQPPMGDPFLLSVLAGVVAGVVNQARFDPKLAIEERDPEAFHRFMIAPRRDSAPEARTRSHLACGSVAGLGGFLSREFRAHDFQLGRRNCQQFLKGVFALPDDEAKRNPLFAAGWTDEARDHYRIVEGPDGLDRPRGTVPGAGDKVYLPIIPLWGTAAEEVSLIDWPRYDRDQLDTLRGQVERRLQAVFRRLIDRNTPNRLQRLALHGALKFFRVRLTDKIIRNLARDLSDRGLLR
jgi:hypothetical protein